MKKKIILGVALIVALGASLVGFSAFEAHVINVTAKIENALSVTPDEIMFGTVFPQEYLVKNIKVALSQSFIDEERVDDIEYFIRQKPKPRPEFVEQMGEGIAQHWCYDKYPFADIVPEDDNPEVAFQCFGPGQCGPSIEEYFDKCYFPLYPYLSKHADCYDPQDPTGASESCNDESIAAFHTMGFQNDVNGYLSKAAGDVEDVWDIDLAVPCFKGMCAQDWADFVTDINPNVIFPYFWSLPAGLEHEMFGCDLWVEVTGVSRSNQVGIYKEADDYPDGDPDNVLGDRIGTLSYEVDGDQLNYTVIIDTPEGQAWVDSGHDFTMALNGPRTGALVADSTNGRLAQAACDTTGDIYDGGWWSNRTLDNTGITDGDCDGAHDTEGDPLVWMEGYWNFEDGVSGNTLKTTGFSSNVSLPAGTYNEVQFLLKDEDGDWASIGEYPGAGEVDGLTSWFDFTIN